MVLSAHRAQLFAFRKRHIRRFPGHIALDSRYRLSIGERFVSKRMFA
jgi:hypothetical protein